MAFVTRARRYHVAVVSKKTSVIEWLFFNRNYDASTGTLHTANVTRDDIADAIRQTRGGLSTNNTANFWKDLTRGGAAALSKNWPARVSNLGFGGTDGIGHGPTTAFRFVRVPQGQAAPAYDFANFDATLPVAPLQSLSMPVAMRSLGRPSENWQAQVAARLDVVASYFALYSPRNVPPERVEEVSFLQTGVKGKSAEIDATFSVLSKRGHWLVAAEIKGRNEEFYLPQIKRAAIELDAIAKAGSASKLSSISGIIPLGIKVVGKSKLWVIELDPVTNPSNPLSKSAEAVFELVPAVPGVE